MTDQIALSDAQERIWFEEQIRPGGTAYHLAEIHRVSGRLDLAALQSAVDTVVTRHAALRTTFCDAEDGSGAPMQRVLPPERAAVKVATTATDSAAAREAVLAEVRRPFDLAHGPLLRVLVISTSADAHLLVLTLHHLICDGWSLGILHRELSTAYAAALSGAAPDLAAVPRRFPDAIRAEQEADAQLAWWSDYIGDTPTLLGLPADDERPAADGARAGARCSLPLDQTLSDAVLALGRAHETTPFMTLLAALGLVLARHTGRERMLVGAPVSTRRAADRTVFGCFLTTLPLALDLTGDPSFRELLARVKRSALDAFAHQDVPFRRLVGRLGAAAAADRAALFQVFFNAVPPGTALELAGCAVELQQFPEIDAKFDLTVYVSANRGRLELEAVYDTALYRRERIADLLDQLALVLDQATVEPERRLGAFALATERAAAAVDSARRELPPAAALRSDPREPDSILERLAEHARTQPDQPALIGPRGVLTYQSLTARVETLAARLAAHGVGRGDVLAVWASRDPAVVVAVLAAIRLNAVFAVLDARLPVGEQRARAELLRPAAWLDAAPGCQAPESPGVPVIDVIDAIGSCPADGSGHATRLLPAPVPAASDEDAYIAFTSGTTGHPRQIIGTHGPLVHFLRWYTRAFALAATDRFSVLSGPGHDPFLRDVLAPLWAGGAAVFPASDVSDVAGVSLELRRAGVTVAHLTPALADALAEAADAGWPSLRLVGFGGDVLTLRTLRAWAGLAPGADLLNLYGTTETPQAVSVHVAHRAGRPAPPGTGRVPLGPGIDETELRVLAGDRPAGIGELGELVVRSPHLARYADAPTGRAPDEYRTGDLGRLRPDGLVEFAGRSDRQIKVRGYRVEPAEIEAALAGLPGVRQALVLAATDGPGASRLVACLAVGSGLRPDPAELRTHLAARLADHKLPAAFIVVDAFPLTANGKVDEAALLRLDGDQAAPASYIAPTTGTEQQLARILGEALGRDRVGVRDDVFALGAHSLLLNRVRVRIRGELGVEVALRDLFDRRTVAALAKLVDRSGPAAPQRPVPRAPETEPAPLSWTQEQIWLDEQLHPGEAAYNMPLVLRLRGPVDAAALQRAVDAVVRRHAVLRSRVFVPDDGDGTPIQQAVADARVPVCLLDLRSAPETAVAEAMRESKIPFELTAGPLLRVLLTRTGDQEHLLVLTAHHIAFDAWSFGVLLDGMSEAYRAALRGLPVEPAEGLNFADIARWQRGAPDHPAPGDESGSATDSAIDAATAWWRARLAGWPTVLDLPTDRPRPRIQAHRGARLRLEIAPATTRRLRALAHAHDGTLFTALLTAFAAVLSRHAGAERMLIGTPVANRDRAEFEQLAGCFLDTVPIPVDLRGAPRFGDLLARVADSALGALAHREAPFGRLVRELAPRRDLSRGPLVQVLFALQNIRLGGFDAPGVACEPVESVEANAQFDLSLRMRETGDSVTGWLDYDTELFDAATADRLADHFTRLAEAVAADPALSAADVDLLGADERHRLVRVWNRTTVPRRPDLTLTGLLEQQARRTPGRIAVRCGDTELSYELLHERAERLARRLRAHGVGPDVVVGVRMQRSVDLVVALLAVLKAGGAYLPLDPEYPEERLALMASDSGIRVLLTAPGSNAGGPADGSVAVLTSAHETDADGTDTDAAEAAAGERPATPAGPGHLAYVIYTSGSTGRPKAVQIPHRGIVNRLLWMQEAYSLGAGDVVLQKTSISFDVSVWELFWPLIAGARLVLAEPGAHRDPDRLARLVRDEQITVCHFVPSMLDAFVGVATGELCSSLRLVVCSGEALPRDLADRFHRVLPHAGLENLYGPTEASVDVTRWSSRPGPDRRAVPIGRPIANTRVYVLDHRMAPVPVGVPGELYLGGVQLARAYGGRPDLTADRFVPDPFSDAGERLYRTGDLARWRPDGALDYLGRTDRQVKLRGFRIEPGEIEAALAAQPGVGRVVVAVREDEPGDRRIVAYLTAPRPDGASQPPHAPDPAALRGALARVLPGHMVPAAFVVLPVLPVGANGKIDHAALPAPSREAAAADGEYVAPSTPTELRLAALWARVLRLDRVGAAENFFALGGDSMHAVRIVGLAREQGWNIALSDLFTHQTVAALAERLTGQAEPARAPDPPPRTEAFSLLSPDDLARLRAR